MRINKANKSVEFEPRDINYFADAYASSYAFNNNNAPPEHIVIPMYAMAKTRYGLIPIDWIPDVSAMAIEIIEDGKDIPDIIDTEKQQQTAIKQDSGTDASMKAQTGIADARPPRMPSGPVIPPGNGGLNLPPRDSADLRKTRADLAPESEIDESKEKEANVTKLTDGSKGIG